MMTMLMMMMMITMMMMLLMMMTMMIMTYVPREWKERVISQLGRETARTSAS